MNTYFLEFLFNSWHTFRPWDFDFGGPHQSLLVRFSVSSTMVEYRPFVFFGGGHGGPHTSARYPGLPPSPLNNGDAPMPPYCWKKINFLAIFACSTQNFGCPPLPIMDWQPQPIMGGASQFGTMVVSDLIFHIMIVWNSLHNLVIVSLNVLPNQLCIIWAKAPKSIYFCLLDPPCWMLAAGPM